MDTGIDRKSDVMKGLEPSLEEIMVFEEEGPALFDEKSSEAKEKAESGVPPFEDEHRQETAFESESGASKPPFGDEPPFEETENQVEIKVDPSIEPTQKKISKRAELEKKVTDIESRVSTIKSELTNIETANKEANETVSKLNGSIQELLSVYEFLTSEINPFLEKNPISIESQTNNVPEPPKETESEPSEVSASDSHTE